MTKVQTATLNSDYLTYLASEGRVFYAADADQNDLVTGQTSFAATTPTFVLNVPTGVIAIPLMVRLAQTGTVAGGPIDVIIEIDNAARYSSGGASETVFNAKTGGNVQTTGCAVYSGATASAGYGIRLAGYTLGQDVTTPSTSSEVLWTPAAGLDFLVGPASFLIYTYAATTGPTWFWTLKWAEIGSGDIS